MIGDNGDSEVNYQQLTCYFCQKPINDLDWIDGGSFTENKPVHKGCYYQKKSELKAPEEEREFTDDDPHGEA